MSWVHSFHCIPTPPYCSSTPQSYSHISVMEKRDHPLKQSFQDQSVQLYQWLITSVVLQPVVITVHLFPPPLPLPFQFPLLSLFLSLPSTFLFLLFLSLCTLWTQTMEPSCHWLELVMLTSHKPQAGQIATAPAFIECPS